VRAVGRRALDVAEDSTVAAKRRGGVTPRMGWTARAVGRRALSTVEDSVAATSRPG
jgi:hypothetical protein